MDTSDIINKINCFISLSDGSVTLAQEIEVNLDELYPEDSYIQNIVVILASYKPSGGDFLYDTEEVVKVLKKLKEKLNGNSNSN